MLNEQIHDNMDCLSFTNTTYTPDLTAVTTNPTLGTGWGRTGSYTQVGRMVTGWGRITFGTSGTNAGSGVYIVQLPVAMETDALLASSCVIEDAATAMWARCMLKPYTSTTCSIYYADGGAVTHNSPFAWGGSGDYIWYAFSYKTAA
jgi:hypothetical protein